MKLKSANCNEATSPSPMMVGGREVGGLSYSPDKGQKPYVIRFTPLDTENNQIYDIQTVLTDFLQDKFEVWMISEETSKKDKIHYHIYLESEKEINLIKDDIREFIYPYYPVRKRGFGTREYNCQYSEDPLKAIMYLLKQRGEYHYSGFSQEFVDSCMKSSFEVEPSEYDKELADLTQEFLKSKMDPYDFAEKICIIYAKYDKRIHFKDIQGIVNSKIIRRDNSKARDMVRKNLIF